LNLSVLVAARARMRADNQGAIISDNVCAYEMCAVRTVKYFLSATTFSREAHLPKAAREPANATSRVAGAAIFAAEAEGEGSEATSLSS
jgi:hypothetical protein